MPVGLVGFDKRACGESEDLVGIDEAGRGCLAGPVVASAVFCEASFYNRSWCKRNSRGVDDSKRLTPEKRAGVVDRFESRGLAIFGPNSAAAQLEGSKAFTKDFLVRHHIATAAYQSFTDVAAAKSYIAVQKPPLVVKADGLAAGKGVIIAQTQQEAEAAVRDMLAGNAFGDAGCRVVIEEFLETLAVDNEDATETRMLSAPRQPRILNSFAGPSLLAGLAVNRFADHQPYYRLEEILQRSQLTIDRGTSNNGCGNPSRRRPALDSTGTSTNTRSTAL